MIQKHMKSLICGKDLNFSFIKSLDNFNFSTLILEEYMWKHVSMLHVAVSHPQVWEWSSNSVYLCVGVCSHASIGVWGREGRNSFWTQIQISCFLYACLSVELFPIIYLISTLVRQTEICLTMWNMCKNSLNKENYWSKNRVFLCLTEFYVMQWSFVSLCVTRQTNTMDHKSKLSAWWHLLRQKDVKEAPIISGICHAHWRWLSA